MNCPVQVYSMSSVCKGNNPVWSIPFEKKTLAGKAVTFLVRHRKEVVRETNKIVWSQLLELLDLVAMEIEQTARDNILYLLDTVVLLFLSF